MSKPKRGSLTAVFHLVPPSGPLFPFSVSKRWTTWYDRPVPCWKKTGVWVIQLPIWKSPSNPTQVKKTMICPSFRGERFPCVGRSDHSWNWKCPTSASKAGYFQHGFLCVPFTYLLITWTRTVMCKNHGYCRFSDTRQCSLLQTDKSSIIFSWLLLRRACQISRFFRRFDQIRFNSRGFQHSVTTDHERTQDFEAAKCSSSWEPKSVVLESTIFDRNSPSGIWTAWETFSRTCWFLTMTKLLKFAQSQVVPSVPVVLLDPRNPQPAAEFAVSISSRSVNEC